MAEPSGWVMLVAGGLAVALPIGFRLSGGDRRWLPAIRWSSLGLVAPGVGVAGAVVGAGMVLAADRRGSGGDLAVVAVVAVIVAFGALAYLTNLGPRRSRAPGGSSWSIVTANLERASSSAELAAGQLLATGADAVVILEYTPATARACEAAGLHRAYQHRAGDPRDGWFGSAVFSRFPLIGEERHRAGQRPSLAVDLDTPTGTVRVVAVHTQAPIHGRDIEPWCTSFDELAAVARSGPASAILAGDFNATLRQAPLRRLSIEAWTDAHRAVGRRLARTWPADRWFPPLLCLDHVLTTPDLVATDVSEIVMAGSDHRAVLVVLAPGQRGG